MFIIKWFNTTLLHLFSCLQPCQTSAVFYARFLSQEENFLESQKPSTWVQKLFCLHSPILLVRQLQKRGKIWACPSMYLRGVLSVLAGLKPLSTANMFHPPRALKTEPHQPYFNASSWLFSILVLKVYAGLFLHWGYQCRDTGTVIRKVVAFSLTPPSKVCGYTSGQ